MVRLLKDQVLTTKFQNFLEEHYKGEIETIALEYPTKSSLYVDFEILDKYDTELSNGLIDEPYKYIFNIEEAIKQIDTVKGNLCLHSRFKNLPEYIQRNIREIRSVDVGKYITIDGLIKKNTIVKCKIIISAFQCNKCGAVVRVEQNGDTIKEPVECYEDQGGCGRVTTFKLLTNLSQFIDAQRIELQENPENLKGNEQPQKITAYLEDDLVGYLLPGDRVKINGILCTKEHRKGNLLSSSFDFIIHTNGFEIKETAYEDINLTEEDIKQIKKESKNPAIYENMVSSIAPSVYGMNLEKEAITLQLFGGVRKILPDNTVIRGDIHTLFIGDPGTAKSQLLKYTHKLSPRSILTSGSSSTAAGLTATAVRDDLNEGQWSLDAGALVLANDGIACIDEFDKMKDQDRGSMHQAMEQQEISIAKAGINVTLKSRCSIMAVANPKLGRYDEFLPIHAQINLAPTLLTRFDLILPVVDKPNKERDFELSGHILRTHQDPSNKEIEPKYDNNFLRKYIAYAKNNIKPKITDETIKKLQDFFTDLRSSTNEGIPITPRQLEALIRLSEASAKIRLSEEVTIEDAERSIRIFLEYLKRVGMDRETGSFDIDIIETGHSHSQQERITIISNVVTELCNSSEKKIATKNDIIAECEIKGIRSNKVEKTLEHMKGTKLLFEPMKGVYRLAK